jgi:hypothetical protein
MEIEQAIRVMWKEKLKCHLDIISAVEACVWSGLWLLPALASL